MNTSPPTLFPRTLERIAHWKADPEVLGVVWVGSMSRGYGGAKSDDDLEVLLTDQAGAERRAGAGGTAGAG